MTVQWTVRAERRPSAEARIEFHFQYLMVTQYLIQMLSDFLAQKRVSYIAIIIRRSRFHSSPAITQHCGLTKILI